MNPAPSVRPSQAILSALWREGGGGGDVGRLVGGGVQHQDKFDRRRGGEEKARKLFSSLSLSLSILFPSVVAGSLPEKENNFLFYLFLIWPNFRQFRDFQKRIVVVYFASHFVCTCRRKVGFRDNNEYKMTSQVKAEAAIEAGAAPAVRDTTTELGGKWK